MHGAAVERSMFKVKKLDLISQDREKWAFFEEALPKLRTLFRFLVNELVIEVATKRNVALLKKRHFYLHIYINSRPFCHGVGRNYRTPPDTILKYSSRLVHIHTGHLIIHARRLQVVRTWHF